MFQEEVFGTNMVKQTGKYGRADWKIWWSRLENVLKHTRKYGGADWKMW